MPEAETKEQATQRFESELKATLGPAFGLAHRLTSNRDDAEDLVREASLRAFKAFDSYQDGSNFKAWFLRILYNLFAKQYAQKRRRVETVDIEEASDLFLFQQTQRTGMHDGNTDPVQAVLGKMDSESIGAAIERLPDEFRDACALYFMEDFSYQEIADILNIPLGSVRSKLHRGRKILQRTLWEVAQQMGIVS